MNLQILVALSLEEAKEILNKNGLDYEITEISGGKDDEILTEKYVVRATNIDNKINLVVTRFKTSI